MKGTLLRERKGMPVSGSRDSEMRVLTSEGVDDSAPKATPYQN